MVGISTRYCITSILNYGKSRLPRAMHEEENTIFSMSGVTIDKLSHYFEKFKINISELVNGKWSPLMIRTLRQLRELMNWDYPISHLVHDNISYYCDSRDP